MGEIYFKLATSNGIAFVNKVHAEGFLPKAEEGSDGVGKVVLSDGSTLDADLVVIGIGVTLSTAFLSKSMPIQKNGTLLVDEFMQVIGLPNVYAAGDVVTFPWTPSKNDPVYPIHIEHWNNALDQGRTAGTNIAATNPSARRPFRQVPFFWTRQFEKALNIAGFLDDGYDDVYLKGNPEAFDFEAYYHRDGRIVAVAAMQRPPLGAHADLLFRSGKMPDLEYVIAGSSLLDIQA